MKKFIVTLLVMAAAAASAFAAPVWQKRHFNVYITENPKSYVMKKAFNKWESATNNKVSFTFVNDETNADMVVTFVETLSGLAVGRCSNWGSGEFITKSNIQLARRNKYKTILTNDEYYRIMLHEIGHALGLSHSDDLNSIMRKTTMEITSISIQDRKDLDELYK